MSIIIDPISPLDKATGVLVGSEIIIHIYNEDPNALDLSTLEITVQDYKELHYVIRGGEFSDDWTGEIIVNSTTDITVILIRHASDPLYPQGGNVYVNTTIEAVP